MVAMQVSHIRTEVNDTTCSKAFLLPFLDLWNMQVVGGLYSCLHDLFILI